MALQGNPVVIAAVQFTDQGTSNTGGTVTETMNLGNNGTASTPGTTAGTALTIGTGTATSVNVAWSANPTLTGGGGGTTYDLTNLTGGTGTKSFAKVRGIFLKNLAAAESGFSVSLKPGASNGFGYFLSGTTPALVIPAGGTLYLDNPQIAAWVVDGTHKNVLIDPGANTQAIRICVWGE